MGTKLPKNTWPTGHGPNDFTSFGPPATKDGEFNGTMICDMGCFKQDGVDSNKYYHLAVVLSTKNNLWYTYYEFARTGAKNPAFQFIECVSQQDAINEYLKQCHAKNDKRGEWYQHPQLGKILRAKAGDDCYLVRPQATRSTGLPSAKTIKMSDGVPQQPQKATAKKRTDSTDIQTLKLIQDLSIATVNYAKGSMADDALPTMAAINEGRDILFEAKKRIVTVGDDIDDQVNDHELRQLTSMMYGRVPKKKDRNAHASEWILNDRNISMWQQDLDAFESALHTVDLGDIDVGNPLAGYNINMSWIDPRSSAGEFLLHWWPTATANKHKHRSVTGGLRIKNMWRVSRKGDPEKLSKKQHEVVSHRPACHERPLFQPQMRVDLDDATRKLFYQTNTALMFHGTRSVNCSGILRENLRMPKSLRGVHISGAMLGDGLYWANDWKKSAGYTSLKDAYYSLGSGAIAGRAAFMFAGDVILGEAYRAPKSFGYDCPPKGHHSVLGKGGHTIMRHNGQPLANDEWVIYDLSQFNLRYLIEFDTGR